MKEQVISRDLPESRRGDPRRDLLGELLGGHPVPPPTFEDNVENRARGAQNVPEGRQERNESVLPDDLDGGE
jgi:hypothetical protein